MAITRSQNQSAGKNPSPSSTPPASAAPCSRHGIRKLRAVSRPKPSRAPISQHTFGLIQERICHNLYHLVVQSILWNQTHGRAARPVLVALLARYPTPASLAVANVPELTALLQPIGLHNIRAKRLVALSKAWLEAPPCSERRYRKMHYPERGCGKDVGKNEVLMEGDVREGWEIAHLPGMGAYALDSYRIFHRDKLRGILEREGVEPEWMKVVPGDKDLRSYLVWAWRTQGWRWVPETGQRFTLKKN